MKKITQLIFLSVCFGFFSPNLATAVNEVEPNNSFATANFFVPNDTMNGTITNGNEDFFMGATTVNGALKIIFTYNNTSVPNTPDLYLYVYNKNQSLIGTYSYINRPLGIGSDSITIFGRQADTIYFRLSANNGFSYNLRYGTIEVGTTDAEPNNSFATATAISHNTLVNGHIGYRSNTQDVNDFFKSYMPADGTIEVVVTYTNTSGTAGADFYMYIYSYQQSLLASISKTNTGFGTFTDTIKIACRTQDSIYVRTSIFDGNFAYNFQYNVIATTNNDIEPNNTFATAQIIQPNTPVLGHVGYIAGAQDGNDYFKTYLPSDGTFVLHIDFTNTSFDPGADFYVDVYSYQQGNIGSFNRTNVGLGSFSDSIKIACRTQDTVYIRTTIFNGCFSYDFTYDVIPTTNNDIEPNNSFATAQMIQANTPVLGHVGYVAGTQDGNDYFKTYLPSDGTFVLNIDFTNTSFDPGADFYVDVYSYQKGNIGSFNRTNVGLGSFSDSIKIACRMQDTLYIRTTIFNGCFSYDFTYYIDSTTNNDIEPNNTFATAQHIQANDTLRGHVGYTSTVQDANDYFVSHLPSDGTIKLNIDYTNTSFDAGADFYVNIYNKDNGVIGSLTRTNVGHGSFTDSMFVYCRAQDTIFIRTTIFNGCFSYAFKYEMLQPSYNDVEPNNSIAQAPLVPSNAPITGSIGHVGSTTDTHDYFKIVNISELSNTRFLLEVNNISNSTGSDFYFYVKNKAGSNLFNQSFVNRPLGIFYDTLAYNCAIADTLFMHIQANGCFEYKITPIINDVLPVAEIVHSRVANAVAFEAHTPNADQITWNFDDGTTSTLKFPQKDFAIGGYFVTLTARNTQCNRVDIDTLFIEVAGIETFAPNSAGAGGDVTMILYGGGLDTTANVYLRKGGVEYKNVLKYASAKRDQLQVMFDLHFADAGFFDVVVEIPNEPPFVFTDGFQIKNFSYPYTRSQVIGPSLWRTNRNTRFLLSVNNSGNVKATGVVVTMIWPKTTTVNFDTEWFTPPSSGNYTIRVEDTDFNWDYAHIKKFFEPEYGAPTPITSFAGKPYDGYMKMIQIATIPAGGTYQIPFFASASATGTQSFITYTSKPNLFGSCGNGSYGDMSENLAVEAIDAIDQGLGLAKMDKTPVGWLAKAVKGTTKHMANLGQVMGATVNYLDGTTNSIYESLPSDFNANVDAGNAQVASAVLEVATDKLVDAGAAGIMKGKTNDLNKWMADNPNASLGSFEFAIDNLNDIESVRQFVRDAYKTGKDLKTLNDKLSRLQQLAKDCPELQKQLDDLKKELDNEMKQREVEENETETVVSMDPNAIYGPVGIDTERYVNGFAQHSFLVTYENVDTATADAQIVRIKVPLDTNAYNVESFVFGDVSIAGETYLVPKLRNNFMIEIDLKATRGMKVRVMGYVDTKDFSANWTFISLDTVTNDLPILDGFLPPNVVAPNGEGSVSYQIDLKSTIADGTQTNSQAEIIFDDNESIFTENWQNIIDMEPSTSFVSTTLEGANRIKMNLNGTDANSGIDFYHVYVSEDGGANWNQLFGLAEDTVTLFGEPGKTYDFYVTSKDRVGNEEVKTPASESTISVPGGDSKFNPVLAVLPNPNLGSFKLRSNGYFYNGELIIANTMGQVVYSNTVSLVLGTDTEINLPFLSSGTYFLRFTTKEEGRITSNKLVIIRP